jgi:hypothetical protein
LKLLLLEVLLLVVSSLQKVLEAQLSREKQ